MNTHQKGFANIILVVVIVVLVGVVGYFTFVKKSEPIAQQPTPTPTQTKTPVSPTPTPKDETASWQTYNSAKSEFSINVPKSWISEEGLPTPYVITYFKEKGEDVLMVDRFQTTKAANDAVKKDLLAWAKKNVAINRDGMDCTDGNLKIVELKADLRAVATTCSLLGREELNVFTVDRHYLIVVPLSLKNKNVELYNKIYQSFSPN